MPHPGLLHPKSLPLWQGTADPYLLRRHSNTQRQVWLSLCGVSWCAQGFVSPSEHLWRVWVLTLNGISLPLQSCWGSSFALGRGVYFLVGPTILLLMAVQQQVVILEFLQKMSACPSTLPSWTHFQGMQVGLNPYLLHFLHWQAGSLLLAPTGSPRLG